MIAGYDGPAPADRSRKDSWESVHKCYKEGILVGDEYGQQSAQRSLDILAKQISQEEIRCEEPSPSPKPLTELEIEPEKAESYNAELARRLNALSDEPTPENIAELEAIEKVFSDLDSYVHQLYPDQEDAFDADKDYG